MVRRGLLWLVAMAVAVVVSPLLVVVLIGPVAAIAALSARRQRHGPPVSPWLVLVAGAGAPITALGGPIPAAVAVIAGGVILAMVPARSLGHRDRVMLALCAMLPAAGSASVVLAARQSVTVALSLLVAVGVFDASNHIMGVGQSGGWIGAAAGTASLGVLALLLAGVLVVPFSGASPWLLCAAVAVAGPAGVNVAVQVVGPAQLPAWRRLDSLFLAGPLWVALAALLFGH